MRTVSPSAGWVERLAAPTSATAGAPGAPLEAAIVLTASSKIFGLFPQMKVRPNESSGERNVTACP